MYNHNFNFGGDFTFQPFNIPAPPCPPGFFIPPMPVISTEKDDIEILKYYETLLAPKKPRNKHPVNISILQQKLKSILSLLDDLKSKENHLRENTNSLSEEDWHLKLKEVEDTKKNINEALDGVYKIDFNILRKLIATRNAKRIRLKRQNAERKLEKEQRQRDREEKSRKINEYMKKIQDEINKAKQEEEAKAVADTVLKDVLRKKQDAKKCLVKLDALIKLRKAKMNTARGRGETVSEYEAEVFNNNIEKLKLLWKRKLSIYEKEEADLRAQLAEGTEKVGSASQDMEDQVRRNLHEWRVALFGGTLPQNNFVGDMQRFVAVRCRWDQYVSSEGTPIPIGWVPPQP